MRLLIHIGLLVDQDLGAFEAVFPSRENQGSQSTAIGIRLASEGKSRSLRIRGGYGVFFIATGSRSRAAASTSASTTTSSARRRASSGLIRSRWYRGSPTATSTPTAPALSSNSSS